MKSHTDRVYYLKLEKEMRERRVRHYHLVSLTGIIIAFIAFVLLGAAIPGFYRKIDSMSPWIPFVFCVTILIMFAYWRLKKMLK